MLVFFLSLVFYVSFIFRSRFSYDGETYFVLFDDSMISMRYGAHLAHGDGLVANPGLPAVEGYSNFLWVIWMSLIHLLPLPDSKTSLAVMISGAAILLANLRVVALLADQLRPGATFFRAACLALIALFHPLVFWTLRGMEVGLLALLASIALLLSTKLGQEFKWQRLIGLGGTLSLMLLTRDDAIVPVFVFLAFVALSAERRRTLVSVGVLAAFVLATVAGHEAFRLAYYGKPLAAPYYLKIEGIPVSARAYRGLVTLAAVALTQTYAPVLLAFSFLPFLVKRLTDPIVLMVSLFIAVCVYSVYVGGDTWESSGDTNRFITPFVPGVLIVAALALHHVVDGVTVRTRMTLVGCSLLLLGVAVLFLLLRPPVQVFFGKQPDAGVRAFRFSLAAIMGFLLFMISWTRFFRSKSTRSNPNLRGAVLIALVVLLMVLSMNGHQYVTWLTSNAYSVVEDQKNSQYALSLKKSTTQEATLAVVAAGAIPYFSDRISFDLLGKTDMRIARSPARLSISHFHPGHDKWDYSYTIGELRPDVLAQLWWIEPADATAIASWGYRPVPLSFTIAGGLHVLSGTPRVNAETLATEMRRLGVCLEEGHC